MHTVQFRKSRGLRLTNAVLWFGYARESATQDRKPLGFQSLRAPSSLTEPESITRYPPLAPKVHLEKVIGR